MSDEIEEHEMDILSILSDNARFLENYDMVKSQYYEMRKLYNERIRTPIIEMAKNQKISIANDIFKVTVSSPRPKISMISKKDAKKLPEDIKELIFYDDMTTPRVRITHIGDEKE